MQVFDRKASRHIVLATGFGGGPEIIIPPDIHAGPEDLATQPWTTSVPNPGTGRVP
jgi:hypothetical protein